MIKIVVDCFGGDRSPEVNVKGAIDALNEIKDLEVILSGDEDAINKELESLNYDKERLSILHAPDVITCHDKPTDAIRRKKDSSLVKAIDLLKNDDTVGGMVSIGSTGAVLSGGVLKVGRIQGVQRPGFCPILPTMVGGFVGICDSGANAECDPLYLQQFAIMGSLYMQKTQGIENPRVALLNIGTEEEKGDTLRKEAYQLLKNTPSINFVGNMESRDLLTGEYDLIVCDGFSGNVLIKSTEGACMELMKLLKKTFMKGVKNKIGALLLKKDIYALKDLMDYNNYGGGVLLGVKKTIVKGHGSSKASAVYHCVKQAYQMEKEKLNFAISKEITKLTTEQNEE